MTIICIKDRSLAFDSHISQGGFKWGTTDKKVREYTFGGKVYYAGGCGVLATVQNFHAFLDDMDDGEFKVWSETPRFPVRGNSTMFLFNPTANHVCEFQDKDPPIMLPLKRGQGYAIGIGCEYAYGHLDAGKTAYEAVMAVTKRFDGCSEPVYRADWKRK